MLIVLSGLPGVGKTTIAQELACALAAVYLRIDSIEQALRQAGLAVEAEGYAVAHAVTVVCSDQVEHRRRVESRAADIAGHRVPTWQEVVERDYRAWDRPRLVIDTARQNVPESVNTIVSALASRH